MIQVDRQYQSFQLVAAMRKSQDLMLRTIAVRTLVLEECLLCYDVFIGMFCKSI